MCLTSVAYGSWWLGEHRAVPAFTEMQRGAPGANCWALGVVLQFLTDSRKGLKNPCAQQ